jgi:transposase
MESNPLLPLPEGMQIDQIQISKNEVNITVIATHPTCCCPLCSHPSSSIHSRYRRTVRDAPCAGRRVQLTLCVRKFFCRNPRMSSEKSGRERLADLVRPWAKMTTRYCEQLTSIGLATCGKGGTRLAARLGMQTSRQTILRRIMALPDLPTSSILYLGIDDFSFRRGCRFGTILVNLESHRVVDLLPDRKAETGVCLDASTTRSDGGQPGSWQRICLGCEARRSSGSSMCGQVSPPQKSRRGSGRLSGASSGS